MAKRYLYPLRDPDHPSKVTLIPCSEEVYYAVMRPIWRERKRRQEHGLCCCPKHKAIFCDSDCTLCDYRRFGKTVSLDAPISDDDEMTLGSILADDATLPDVFIESLLVQMGLTQLDSEEYQVLIAVTWYESEREAADHLGMARSTFKRRLDRARKHARDLMGDIL